VDNDCDGVIDAGDPGCAVTITTCGTLGDQPAGQEIDEDVWTISGSQGESITIVLDPNGPASGRADLVLVDEMGSAVDFFRIDRTVLSNQITATLPADGPYRIAVNEQPAGLLLPGTPFRGDYCLSVDSDGGAAQTLAPTSSVEGVPANR
jgi:hypothetical protein